jgi:hypothetical protein
MPRIAVTYELITHESSAQGAAEDRGWETSEEGDEITVDEYDIEDADGDENLALARAAAKYITQRGGVQCSSSDPSPGDWYTTMDDDIDYSNGDRTSYSYHLRDFLPEVEELIAQLL